MNKDPKLTVEAPLITADVRLIIGDYGLTFVAADGRRYAVVLKPVDSIGSAN